MHTASVCVYVLVCVYESEIQRDLRCGPCPCHGVYVYRLVLCASILCMSLSVLLRL
jgi:hypothetical protein